MDRPRVAKESLFPTLGLGTLKLLTDQMPHGDASSARRFLQPREKFVCKTHCQCVTHMNIL